MRGDGYVCEVSERNEKEIGCFNGMFRCDNFDSLGRLSRHWIYFDQNDPMDRGMIFFFFGGLLIMLDELSRRDLDPSSNMIF